MLFLGIVLWKGISCFNGVDFILSGRAPHRGGFKKNCKMRGGGHYPPHPPPPSPLWETLHQQITFSLLNFLWEFVCYRKGWRYRKICWEKVNFGQKSFIGYIFSQFTKCFIIKLQKPNKNQWIKNYTVLWVWTDETK